MQVRARMWQGPDGAWQARADLAEPVLASGATAEACIHALGDRVRVEVAADRPTLVLIVETIPALVGVAEAAQVMGWDKRRVVTYLDRGTFPPPVQGLRSGRVWVRSDVERFAREWRARLDARRRAASRRRRERPSDAP